MESAELVAFLINVGLVAVIVQGIKLYVLPVLRRDYDWSLPILAQLMGPLMLFVSEWFSAKLGFPVDFSPIAGLFSGAVAAAMFKPFREVGRLIKGGKA